MICALSRAPGRLCAALVLAVGLSPAPRAQPDAIGQIEEMRRDRKPVEATDAVRLSFGSSYARKPARQRDALHARELVELLEPYYVRASLAHGGAEARIAVGSSGAPVGDFAMDRRGAYEILPSGPRALSGLELRIRHGVLVVEHAAGRLDAWMARTRTRVLGTTVLFDADSTRLNQFVFLERGHLQFPDHGIDVQGHNVAFRLRPGGIPQRVSLSEAERRRLRREVEHLTDRVWRGRPLWARPAFYLPVGVAVGAAAVLLLTRDGGGGADVLDGTLTIRIPD